MTTSSPLTFYLGAHHSHWLPVARVPLFVSRRTLCRIKKLPRAAAPWALDSGGFSELTIHGRWTLSPREYVAEVRRFRDEVGSLAFAAPMDLMCEASMLKRTGLTVADHVERTVSNYQELRELAPDLPFIPVLQGWTLGNYLDCCEAYDRAGVDLLALPLVGIGTVCRRQHTMSAEHIIRHLADDGLKLHGFGFKVTGLRGCSDVLASADSMAWSFSGRRNPPIAGHEVRHKNCANCIEYAMQWRQDLLDSLERDQRQLSLAGVA